MQTVVNNILTNYEVFGEESANPVLILHGWGQSLMNWTLVANKLSEKNRVITLDLPGFGSSSLPPKPYGVKEYSPFLKNFTRKIGLKDPVLIGHSLGGKIAINLSSNVDFITKLILISPSGIGPKPFLANVKIIIFKILNPLFFWSPVTLKEKFVKLFASEDYKLSGNLKETFKKIVNQNVEKDAQKITIPTLIVWGENDKELNPKNSKLLKRLIKNSVIRIVWGAGHSPNIEVPDKLSNLLSEYI